MSRFSRFPLLALAALVALSASGALAQQTPPTSRTLPQGDVEGQFGRVERVSSNVESYFFFVQPGEPTIQVYVVGAVVNPGLYEVGPDVDLGRLLALAGGPLLDAQQAERRRQTTVALYRAEAGASPIYEADLGASFTDVGAYPVLREGDTLLVETIERQRLGWRDLLAVGGALGGIAFFINAVDGN